MARSNVFQARAFFYRPEVGKIFHFVVPYRGAVTTDAALAFRQELNRRLTQGGFPEITGRLGYIPHISTLHITENAADGRVLAKSIAPSFEVAA